MDEMDVIFIRHGWTKFNEEGAMCGLLNPGLSKAGRNELCEMVKRFPYPRVDKLYSSPLKRCIETAGIVYPSLEPEIVEGLHEMDFGIYDGCPAALVKTEFRGFGPDGDETVSIPGGESKADVWKRMRNAMEWIVTDAAEGGCRSIAVVGHSLAFSQLFKHSLEPCWTREQAFCPNGMGMLMRIEPEAFAVCHRMEYIECLPKGADRPDMSLSPYM